LISNSARRDYIKFDRIILESGEDTETP